MRRASRCSFRVPGLAFARPYRWCNRRRVRRECVFGPGEDAEFRAPGGGKGKRHRFPKEEGRSDKLLREVRRRDGFPVGNRFCFDRWASEDRPKANSDRAVPDGFGVAIGAEGGARRPAHRAKGFHYKKTRRANGRGSDSADRWL